MLKQTPNIICGTLINLFASGYRDPINSPANIKYFAVILKAIMQKKPITSQIKRIINVFSVSQNPTTSYEDNLS
jgi:hypothetical protein